MFIDLLANFSASARRRGVRSIKDIRGHARLGSDGMGMGSALSEAEAGHCP